MAVRASMAALIQQVRDTIGDAPGPAQQFSDQQIQDRLDNSRDTIRYELLQQAPSLVNVAGQPAAYIWSDYHSRYPYWETDAVLQATVNGVAWTVVTPVVSDYLTGHWQFEANVFSAGTVPGQIPPVFITGRVYDPYAAAVELLTWWAALYARRFDATVGGQTFRRSQATTAMLALARELKRKMRVRSGEALRTDYATASHAESVPLLGNNDELNR